MLLHLNLINKTILVVDDEENNWLFIKDLLEDTKVNLIWAIVGQQAIDIVSSGQKIDLILMDMKMPVLDGFETTRKIKEINNAIPVIAHTAFAMPEERDKCIASGCDAYISKPFNIDEFLALINDILKNPGA